MHKALLLLLFFIFSGKCLAHSAGAGFNTTCNSCLPDTIANNQDTENRSAHLKERPSPILRSLRMKQQKSKKTIATVLAFPLPFGIVGLHRIYLGSAPYVPVAYIASLGGVFGILPFIDFCVLLASKKTDPYINNEKIFMWVN